MTRALRHPGRIAGLAFLPLAAVPWGCIVSHFRHQHHSKRHRVVKLGTCRFYMTRGLLPWLAFFRRLARRQDIRGHHVQTRALLAVLLEYNNPASALDRYRIASIQPQKLRLHGFIEGDHVHPKRF